MNRQSTAVWNGTIKEGKGQLTSQSGTLNKTAYSFISRFEDGSGTNPEELMAAAHAGCFTMKLSLDLGSAGFTADELTTTSTISLENGVIAKSSLVLYAKVPHISEEQFLQIAQKSKETCPVSKAYNVNITLSAHLI